MLRRRFAVIKLWPGVKAAEDEVIERLKIAAKSLGLECLVVDPSARLIQPPHTRLTQQDVDFVLSLHFEAPKQFDIFSFVTLWNPLQFYYEWGYRKFTRHLLTHDDFLSCDSVSGDDHVMRLISGHPAREGPLFRFYPTLSGPILEPTLGDQHLFYAGMNWEKTAKKPGRHDGLLGLLDDGGDLRIYGPRIYNGVEVWKGYKSYVGSIPFDGVSVVRLINQAGISLVLSSQAHAQSEMMSSRIFESSAAGAVIICNENPFARRHFGDSLLYIDTTLPVKETYRQVESHLDWIKSEPTKALELARRAQSIFRENFRLDTCLERIYAGLPERKAKLECAYAPKRREESICVVFLMPEFHAEILERHIASCQAQKNVAIRGILAIDARDAELFGPRGIRSRINESPGASGNGSDSLYGTAPGRVGEGPQAGRRSDQRSASQPGGGRRRIRLYCRSERAPFLRSSRFAAPGASGLSGRRLRLVRYGTGAARQRGGTDPSLRRSRCSNFGGRRADRIRTVSLANVRPPGASLHRAPLPGRVSDAPSFRNEPERPHSTMHIGSRRGRPDGSASRAGQLGTRDTD